jgi:hypothetical protein
MGWMVTDRGTRRRSLRRQGSSRAVRPGQALPRPGLLSVVRDAEGSDARDVLRDHQPTPKRCEIDTLTRRDTYK